jgi:hypothetical protein
MNKQTNRRIQKLNDPNLAHYRRVKGAAKIGSRRSVRTLLARATRHMVLAELVGE